ncbi:MAG: RlmE family RNA methyltransferase [Rhodospirillales bacterium]|nr:RlmE family RNA methyltransferase [Rhodospirillales bacterium]MDP6805619.1 RlmE family RNA methyltransferase [Rhodospirillales bacterium]
MGGKRRPRAGVRSKAKDARTGRGLTPSSARWLARQRRDRFAADARAQGLRSRAAFKLMELDDRFGLLARRARIVDLGAAPGGWTQVAVERTGAARGEGCVVALDLGEVEPVPGAAILIGDVHALDAPGRVLAALGGPADAVLSDMAAPATGHAATDGLRAVALGEAALAFALRVLAPGGTFAFKLLMGPSSEELVAHVKRHFGTVKQARPKASRKESKEVYVIALDLRRPNLSQVGGQDGGPNDSRVKRP